MRIWKLQHYFNKKENKLSAMVNPNFQPEKDKWYKIREEVQE